LVVAVVVAAAALGIAACGSSSSSSSGSTSGSGSTTGATSSGGGFTYGYSIPTGQNPWINTIAEAAQATAGAAGGEGEVSDSKLEPGTAVAQLTRSLAAGANVLAVAPAQVPQALQSTLGKATSGGAAALATEWSFVKGEPEAAPQAPVQGQANIDREKLAIEVMETINAADPAGAKVIFVGLPFPTPPLDFFEEILEEQLGKSELVANLDDPTDNAQGALGPLNGALAANSDATAIVTYSGPSALAAVEAVKSAGLTGKVDVYSIELDTAVAKDVEAGTVAAAWDMNPIELGEALGELMVAAGEGKPEAEWAKTVVVDAKKYTKENIGSWKDWASGS
jgi:ABC-type sugar transport system substrate-binding protein